MRLLNYSFFFLLILFSSFISADTFKIAQMKYPRVKKAYDEKETNLKNLYKEKNIAFGNQEIFLRMFKKEQELELWARTKGTGRFILIKKYPVCSSSGDLGPKRRRGDGQVPEGFYFIDRFNPQSSFHLSLGLNYPNASDKILGDANPGGDIFIHGSCVTIGCIPLTDNLVKEVYLLSVEAKNNGQSRIPVHVFPCRMNEANFQKIKEYYSDDKNLIRFWENIKPGYDYFEKTKTIPKITVEANGKYKVS